MRMSVLRYAYSFCCTRHFLCDQVMSRAIRLYVDRVTLSLGVLRQVEDEEKALDLHGRSEPQLNKTAPDESTDDAPSLDPEGGLTGKPNLINRNSLQCSFCASVVLRTTVA